MSRRRLLGIAVAAILVGSLCVTSRAVQAERCRSCNTAINLASAGNTCFFAKNENGRIVVYTGTLASSVNGRKCGNGNMFNSCTDSAQVKHSTCVSGNQSQSQAFYYTGCN